MPRRDALQLVAKGLLAVQENDLELGYKFFPTGTGLPDRKNAVDHRQQQGWQSEPIIEADFREIPSRPTSQSSEAAPSSDSRTLVPAGQPFDSRVVAALAQHNRAKARALRSSQGFRIGGQVVSSLDQLFQRDPDGSHTLAAIELAEVQATREKLAREREAASRALAVRPREPTNAEMFDLWSGMQDRARQRRWEEYQASKQPIDEPGSDLDRIPWDVRAPVDRIREEQKQAPANPTADRGASRSPPPDFMTSLKARKPAPPEPRSKSWSEWFWGKSSPPVWR